MASLHYFYGSVRISKLSKLENEYSTSLPKNIQISQSKKKLVKVCLQTFNLTDSLSPKRIKIGEKARESLFIL